MSVHRLISKTKSFMVFAVTTVSLVLGRDDSVQSFLLKSFILSARQRHRKWYGGMVLVLQMRHSHEPGVLR
jgi:hypothetical protein